MESSMATEHSPTFTTLAPPSELSRLMFLPGTNTMVSSFLRTELSSDLRWTHVGQQDGYGDTVGGYALAGLHTALAIAVWRIAEHVAHPYGRCVRYGMLYPGSLLVGLFVVHLVDVREEPLHNMMPLPGQPCLPEA